MNMKNLMDTYKKSSSIRNFGDSYDFLDERKLDILFKKVSSSVLRRQNSFYYANLYDVFLILESYDFAKSMISEAEVTRVINKELGKHNFNKEVFAKYMEERNFELLYLKREKKNFGFYLQHAEEKERK